MPVPMLDLGVQNAPLKDQVLREISALIDRSAFILGPAVESFERNLASACRSKHAIGMSSGTDTLLAALIAYNIGPGHEVIVPAFTFFATASVVSRVGATPVFVDIDPATYNIDPAAAVAAITPATGAIIPVHLFGQCADMDPLLAAARPRSIPVIEDAAQAIGAQHHGKPAGSIADVGSLSFYPTKNLGAFGDAGALLTDDAQLAARLRQIRLHGQTDEYRHEIIGGNFRIDALQAAILSIKLTHLDAYTAGRIAAAEKYHSLLKGLPLTLPLQAPGNRHVYNQYTIATDRRDDLSAHLKRHGIGHRVYYPLPLHLQPCFARLGGMPGQHPVAELTARSVLSLPMYPEIPSAHIEQTAAALRSFFHR